MAAARVANSREAFEQRVLASMVRISLVSEVLCNSKYGIGERYVYAMQEFGAFYVAGVPCKAWPPALVQRLS
jgi:hypothetical protein